MLKVCTIRREDYFPASEKGLITTETKVLTVGSIWLTILFNNAQILAWSKAGYDICEN